MKPGYKTTEFWLSFLAVLLGFFVTSGVVGPDHVVMKIVGLGVSVLAALGYTAARAGVKKSEAAKEALRPTSAKVD